MEKRRQHFLMGGFNWALVQGFELSKQEFEMLDKCLPLMEKRTHQAVESLRKMNSEVRDDFHAEVSLSTVRFVFDKKGEGHSYGMTGKYPDLTTWRVEVSEGIGRKAFMLRLLKQSEEMGDATYYQPVAYTPVEQEDLDVEYPGVAGNRGQR